MKMNKMMKYPQRETPSAINTIRASSHGFTPLEEVVSIIRPRLTLTLAVSDQRDSDLVSAFQIGAKHINQPYGLFAKTRQTRCDSSTGDGEQGRILAAL